MEASVALILLVCYVFLFKGPQVFNSQKDMPWRSQENRSAFVLSNHGYLRCQYHQLEFHKEKNRISTSLQFSDLILLTTEEKLVRLMFPKINEHL